MLKYYYKRENNYKKEMISFFFHYPGTSQCYIHAQRYFHVSLHEYDVVKCQGSFKYLFFSRFR